MQSLDNWVSAGDICEAWPCDPGKNALKVGGKLPLPVHHGLQDRPAAAQQTTTENNNTADQESMKKMRKRWEKRGKHEDSVNVKRGREFEGEKITHMEKIHRRTLCLTGLAVSYSFAPLPWDHFHPLWVKRKPGWKWKVTQARARALGVREEKIPAARALLLFKAPAIVWAPIQAHCCAEISRAPFGSLRLQRHAADPLVVLGSDTWLDWCVALATITTGCGPLPSL